MSLQTQQMYHDELNSEEMRAMMGISKVTTKKFKSFEDKVDKLTDMSDDELNEALNNGSFDETIARSEQYCLPGWME